MTQMSNAALAHIEARGLDPELVVRLGFSSQPAHGGGEELVIPFARNGQVVRRKYRTFGPDKTFRQDKGGVKCVWNEDVLRDDTLISDPVLITEGELDAVAAIQAGFTRTISVPDGAPPPNDNRDAAGLAASAKYNWLDAIRPLLTPARVPHFVLATDGDEPGAGLMHDLALLLGRTRCKYVAFPKARDANARGRERLKDLNEVLEDYGVAGVKSTIGRAEWLRAKGVFRMSELPPLPSPRIYDVDFPLFAKHYRLRLGDFAVFTGVPGFGKTSFVNDLMCRVAHQHGLTIGWASFEQAPQRDHRRSLRTWFQELPEYRQNPEELRQADEWIDAHHRFLVPGGDEEPTLEWLIETMEGAVIQHGCKVLVVDPWNEMTHDRSHGETLTEYTGRAIKTLKRFAGAMQVHLVIVAHPVKQTKGLDGKYAMPSLYDISDSAHWYNKADLGVIVHRPDADNSIIKVQKSRYHEVIGEPGSVTMQFSRDTRRFIEQHAGEPG